MNMMDKEYWELLVRGVRLIRENPNHPLLSSPGFIGLREGVNLTDEHGNTPLTMASSAGPVEAVGALLSIGANVNARNHDGITALMFAAHKQRVEIVELLLAYHADVNVISNEGRDAKDYVTLSVPFTKVFAAVKIKRMIDAARFHGT